MFKLFYKKYFVLQLVVVLFLFANPSLAIKSPPINDSAVRYVELLTTRIWLKIFTKNVQPGIPKFIPTDRLCTESEVNANLKGWKFTCIPVKVSGTFINKSFQVKISLSPGVEAETLMKQVREVLLKRNLETYVINKFDPVIFNKNVKYFLEKDPSLQQLFQKGFLSTGWKTYPELEELFALKVINSAEILNSMRAIVISDFKIEVDNRFITTLKFSGKSLKN